MPLYRAPSHGALLLAPLDDFTAVFHRPSGITHLLAAPAPEILAALADVPMTREALLARLDDEYDVEGGVEALAARLDELVAAGLVAPA